MRESADSRRRLESLEESLRVRNERIMAFEHAARSRSEAGSVQEQQLRESIQALSGRSDLHARLADASEQLATAKLVRSVRSFEHLARKGGCRGFRARTLTPFVTHPPRAAAQVESRLTGERALLARRLSAAEAGRDDAHRKIQTLTSRLDEAHASAAAKDIPGVEDSARFISVLAGQLDAARSEAIRLAEELTEVSVGRSFRALSFRPLIHCLFVTMPPLGTLQGLRDRSQR